MSQVFTIPKAGTNFMIDLFRQLEIPVHIGHDTPPPSKIGKNNVILIRDMKDVVCSVPYWIDKIASGALKDHPYIKHPLTPSYSKLSEKEKVLQSINRVGLPKEHMDTTYRCCKFVIEMLKRNDTMVVRFEDIMPEVAGGNLNEEQRVALFQNMCSHIGHPRSSKSIEEVLENIWGKSITYNPVEKKVRRWEALFESEHKDAFMKIWDKLNVQLGYPSLLEEESNKESPASISASSRIDRKLVCDTSAK